MKTHFKSAIDKMKKEAAGRRGARDATAMLKGEWVCMGVADCPDCGGEGALRICDGEDGKVVSWCLNGCDPGALRDALVEAFDAQDVSAFDTPPWERED